MNIRNVLACVSLMTLLPIGGAWANTAADTVTHGTMVSGQVEAPQFDLYAETPEDKHADDSVVTRTEGLDTTGLNLRYAGATITDGGTGNALALVFTGEFSPESDFSDYIMVIDAGDKHVPGRWHVAGNGNVLFFPVAHAGKYRVILTPGLRDRDGDVLRQRYHGTVDVK